MEQQIFPLLTTTKNGDGTVLIQNHLGDFGLERLLNMPQVPTPALPAPATTSTPTVTPTESTATPIFPASAAIPGSGIIINARQLVQVFSGLSIDQLSCARIIPDQLGKPLANTGILLFTTKESSPRAKGGAMEFEFSGGKINRIAFQLPTYRDFEQDLLDHPEVGGCRIEPSFLIKLH
jgi:hypothetical protein